MEAQEDRLLLRVRMDTQGLERLRKALALTASSLCRVGMTLYSPPLALRPQKQNLPKHSSLGDVALRGEMVDVSTAVLGGKP